MLVHVQAACLAAWLKKQGYTSGTRKGFDYVLSNKLAGSVGVRNSGAVELIGLQKGVMEADALLERLLASFRMPVGQVFYVKGLDRVIAIGVVAAGSVKAGDNVAARSRAGLFPTVVEKLEHPNQQMTIAEAGQDVGLMPKGISKERVHAGDVVVRLGVGS